MAHRGAVQHLRDAVQSILQQTYTNFEFIIVDDGADALSAQYLSATQDADDRIVLLKNTGSGLAGALNYAATHASGDFLARMDSDDISHPNRFARQIELLTARNSPEVLGSGIGELSHDGESVVAWSPPLSEKAIRESLVRRPPIAHVTVMMRRDAFDKSGGYRDFFAVSQDYDLWLRMIQLGIRLNNTAEPLVTVRRKLGQQAQQRGQRQYLYGALAQLSAQERASNREDTLVSSINSRLKGHLAFESIINLIFDYDLRIPPLLVRFCRAQVKHDLTTGNLHRTTRKTLQTAFEPLWFRERSWLNSVF